MRQQSYRADDHVIDATFFEITGKACESFIERPFTHKVATSFLIHLYYRCLRLQHYKYSSTFLIISRIWNGRPLTFENATASIKYFARIIVQSWPRFISGMITVSKPDRTSPRFLGNGFR